LQGQQLYTVYTTAPKDVSGAVLVDIEEVASNTDVDIAWEEPRQGKFVLRLSGTDTETIANMKAVFEAIFFGHVATTWSTRTSLNSASSGLEIWHDFFATALGDIWLRHLERQTGTIIRSDKLQQRLRTYPVEDSTLRSLLHQMLAEQIVQLNEAQERQFIPLETKQFRAFIASDKVALAQGVLSKENVSLDILNKCLVLHCSRKTGSSRMGWASLCFHCGEPTIDNRQST
jgi:hypothetical protein